MPGWEIFGEPATWGFYLNVIGISFFALFVAAIFTLPFWIERDWK
jgi:hypothetical protein